MTALFFLLFTASANLDSFEYFDLTRQKWSHKEDPKVAITEMEIAVGDRLYKQKWTGAVWKARTQGCDYTLQFEIKDRKGGLIAKERKSFVYTGKGEDKFNSASSNILSSGMDHSAKFKVNFYNKDYLTINYWISDQKCKASKPYKAQPETYNRAITLEETLRRMYEQQAEREAKQKEEDANE